MLAFIDSLQPASAAPAPAHRAGLDGDGAAETPPAERDAVLAEQAAALADDYRNDPDLTAFEAFGDEGRMSIAPTPRRGDVWLAGQLTTGTPLVDLFG